MTDTATTPGGAEHLGAARRRRPTAQLPAAGPHRLLAVGPLLVALVFVSFIGCDNPPPPQESTSPGASVSGTPGEDRQGDLVKGTRILTGSVERAGTCTVLVVATQRWALVGPAADALIVGQKVTITGQLTELPVACAEARTPEAVRVNQARPAG